MENKTNKKYDIKGAVSHRYYVTAPLLEELCR